MATLKELGSLDLLPGTSLLPPGRPFIASARTLTGTVWSTFGQGSSTLVRNKFIVVEKQRALFERGDG